ncbi:serine hydrolase, partial [candidate division GN15 bacterium]|nr:serine hydrolase [candidate division GN15 bacterium]
MQRTVIAVISAIFVSLLFGCGGQSTNNAQTDTFDAYLSAAADVWQFQGTVLVAQGDSVLFTRGYGPARLDRDVMNTPDLKYCLGSVTKAFTAVAIMQLWDQGLIDLDAPFATYLPDYRSDIAQSVTIHHLLSHTSGIADLVNDTAFIRRAMTANRSLQPEELLTYSEPKELLFQPGDRFAYSSANFVLLGLIIDSVCGEPPDVYIQRHICRPASMINTGVFPGRVARDDFALGYHPGPDRRMIPAPVLHPSFGYAAGDLSATVDDLHRFHLALENGTLLSDSARSLMERQHTRRHGYAWYVNDFGGHRLIADSGAVPGFAATWQRWPDDSLCLVILSNNAAVKTHHVANALAAIALEEPYYRPLVRNPGNVRPADLIPYTGVYQAEQETRRIDTHGDQLKM